MKMLVETRFGLRELPTNYLIDGLAVVPCVSVETGMWQVVHVGSGVPLPGAWKTEVEARCGLNEWLPLTDWTRPRRELRQSAVLRKKALAVKGSVFVGIG